ncbi:hypothetical protein BASA84_001315 [Batrachochytrium salamandrivorans]|nr:hypothetical protein BASA84_001315 [Batrachochytrium salamandrivorans]
MVSHPSQSLDYREDTNPIRGLMYADDVAVFADSEQSLLAASTGLLSNGPIDHSAWLKQKRSAIEHTISALHPVLANHQLTVNYQSRIFSAVVMAKPTMGWSWLVATSHTLHHCKRQSTRVSDCSLVPDSRLPLDPFWLKLGLGHFLTRSLVSPSTLVGARLCIAPKYVTRQLLDTSGFFKDPSFDQSRAHGTRYLMLTRMDALWTARKAIQIGILVDTHPFSVDHCILCDQQLLSTSIAHLVVKCEQVNGHRIQSGLVPAIQKSRLRLLGRALDPGVENVYTWLRGGVLNGEADLDQRWLDGTVEK